MITAGSLSKGRNTGSIDVADQVQVPGCRRFHKYPSFSLFLLKKAKSRTVFSPVFCFVGDVSGVLRKLDEFFEIF